MKWRLCVLLILVLSLSGCLRRSTGLTPLDEEPVVTLLITGTGQRIELPVEEYIMGVVAGEMFVDWPENALAAQAIFARSFTMELLSRGQELTDDIERTQAYNPNQINDRVRAAVEKTRGEVMVYQGRLVSAWFHAYSGGRTTSARDGLNYQDAEPGFIHSVEDPGAEVAPDDVLNWEFSLPLSQVAQRLSARGNQVSNIQNVVAQTRNDEGRVTVFAVEHGGGTLEIPGAEFRLAMGSTEMRSIWVNELEVADGVMRMTGQGYGHGVGMSQWGAFAMAEQGRSPEEIVSHWFRDVEIFNYWE